MDPKLFSVIVGICAFVVAFALGSLITVTTGIPLAGGLLNGVLVAMILTIGMVASPHKWTGTMMWLAFSIPAIVTTTLGPPGFYKPIVALAAGVSWDVFHRRIFPNNKWLGLYGGAVVGGILITALIIFILQLILSGTAEFLSMSTGLQASLDRLLNFIWYLIPINIIVTVAGVWLGEFVYRTRLTDVITIEE